MSVNLYPAILSTDHVTGAKSWENVVPMQGDSERLCAEAKKDPMFEGSAFEPNPEYFPFSDMGMSEGNLTAIIRHAGIEAEWDDSSGKAEIQNVFEMSHRFLNDNLRDYCDVEIYVIERVFALREMSRLGISRGATHIVWA